MKPSGKANPADTAAPPGLAPEAVASQVLMPSQAENETSARKLALVSHDYNQRDSSGLWDYSQHFDRINQLCDEQGCDTIVYALFTWDVLSTIPKNHDTIFGGRTNLRRVLLEAGTLSDPWQKRVVATEIWRRGDPEPMIVRQKFALSREAWTQGAALVAQMDARQVDGIVPVLCGESNVVFCSRKRKEVDDPFHVTEKLDELGVSLILNPIHDYMRRPEMREKRRFLSRSGRTVVSVWNKGRRSEAHIPWTVFHDEKNRTSDVRELPRPFDDRPDIRIGVLDLEALLVQR